MRYFTVIDFQHVVLLLFLGAVVFVILYVAFGGYRLPSREEQPHVELEEYPGDIKVGDSGIPPLVIFVIVGFIAWALGYLIVIGLLSGPF